MHDNISFDVCCFSPMFVSSTGPTNLHIMNLIILWIFHSNRDVIMQLHKIRWGGFAAAVLMLMCLIIDPEDPEQVTGKTRHLGLVVIRGTQVSLVSPEDGLEEIANPFLGGAEEEEEEEEDTKAVGE